MSKKPEEEAREKIDSLLEEAGWHVQRAERLRQSILKKAFSGQLV